MSLEGQLEDVPFVDVLQFIKFSGRSGTLVLERDGMQTAVGLHEGNIVSVSGSAVKRIGQYLVTSGAVSSEKLLEALGQQRAQDPPPPLGGLLVETGVVSREQLLGAFRAQVEETVMELVSWARGSFHFHLDELRPVDDLALSPHDLGDVNINTQHVLLEATRLLDERTRPAAGASPGGRPERAVSRSGPVPVPPEVERSAPRTSGEFSRLRVQVVSHARDLARAIGEALAEESFVVAVEVTEAAATTTPGVTALTLVDVRAKTGLPVDALSVIRSARPLAALVAYADPTAELGAIYGAGASAVVHGDVSALAACLRAVDHQQKQLSPDRVFAEGLTAGFAKLRRLIGEIRSGVLSATVSLDLLNLISESVERAVFFLVRPTTLAVLGAFGRNAEGRPLAEHTRGLKLDLADSGILGSCITDREVRALECDDPEFPQALLGLIGRPHSGRCAVLPVIGGQSVMAVIYVDNGTKNWPVDEIEFLELAVAQMGMAFENELLRRDMQKSA